MSALLTRERLRRYAGQLAVGLGIGVTLGVAVSQARPEDAASLLANPRRLDEVQRGCKTNAPWANEALCRDAAQAIRVRFRGHGVPYTPHRVVPFPSQPSTPPSTGPAKPKPEASHHPTRPHASTVL